MTKVEAVHHQYECTAEGDLFRLEGKGDLDAQATRAIAKEMLRVGTENGRIYVLISLNGLAKPSPESRRVIFQSIRELPLRGAAYFGGNAVMRTLLSMVHHASRLIAGYPYHIGFFSTEGEARAWLAGIREGS